MVEVFIFIFSFIFGAIAAKIHSYKKTQLKPKPIERLFLHPGDRIVFRMIGNNWATGTFVSWTQIDGVKAPVIEAREDITFKTWFVDASFVEINKNPVYPAPNLENKNIQFEKKDLEN